MGRRNLWSRRASLQAIAVVVASLALPRPALALTDAEAADLIRQLIAELYAVTDASRPDALVFREVEEILGRYSELPVIARSSLGAAWRVATDDQKARYIKVFAGYLSRKYGRRFRDFAIAEVVVSNTRKVTSGYMVSSTVHMKDGPRYGIEWQVVNIGGKEKLVNLTIEGLSMLASERNGIASMLDERRGDIDKLIDDLASKG